MFNLTNSKKFMKRIAALMLLFGVVFLIFSKYVKIARYPRFGLNDFYSYIEKDMVDVLCIGSSHVSCSINSVQMYDDYGIAAYNLSGPSQSIWLSYYFALEGLKTQKPSIVILDVYTVIAADDYFDSKIEANLLNMKPSYDKYKALLASNADNISSILFEFPVTHSRYRQLRKEDYNIGKNNELCLGYSYHSGIVPYNPEKLIDVRGGRSNTYISKSRGIS